MFAQTNDKHFLGTSNRPYLSWSKPKLKSGELLLARYSHAAWKWAAQQKAIGSAMLLSSKVLDSSRWKVKWCLT